MMARLKSLVLVLSITICNLTFGQIEMNKSAESCNIKLELPADYSLVSQNDKMREQYQSSDGCAFGYDIGKELNSFQDVEILSAMTAAQLSESLSDFKLIFHDNESYIGDQRYVLVVYSCEENGEGVYNALFMTLKSGNLVTFSFGCALEIAESKVPELNEIMESVFYDCR